MKRLSWKYIAGLVDGEGCVDMQRVRDPRTKQPGTKGGDYAYVRPRLRIAFTEPGLPILEMLKQNFGGSIYKHKPPKNELWTQAYTWQLEGKRLRPLLQNIANHLIIKKEQAKLCILVIDHVMGKHVSDELREHLIGEFKAMKLDPQRLSERAVSDILSMR